MVKNLLYILPLTLLLVSCYDYEEDESVIAYGRQSYQLSDLLMEDWGDHVDTHYNMDFSFVGEQTVFEENENAQGNIFYTLSEEIDCYIFVELFSAGSEKFSPGIFHAKGDDDFEDRAGEHVFRRFVFGRSLSEAIEAEDGTITLTIDSRNTYRLKYDVTLQNGKALTGKFAGIPIYSDRR